MECVINKTNTQDMNEEFLNDLSSHNENKRTVYEMAPSKLEKYLNVLEVLVDRPKKLDVIAYMAKMECNTVKRSLEFLISNGLVEERSLRDGKRVVYAVNERGLSVFKTLRMLKYLEKLKDTLPIVEEAREITPMLNQRSREELEEE